VKWFRGDRVVVPAGGLYPYRHLTPDWSGSGASGTIRFDDCSYWTSVELDFPYHVHNIEGIITRIVLAQSSLLRPLTVIEEIANIAAQENS